jgi:hypothetical protein
MEPFVQIILFVVGALLTCKALSMFAMQWYLLSYRDRECIPRIVHHQKVVDGLIMIYYAIVIFLGGWLMSYAVTPIFCNDVSLFVANGLPIVLIGLFIIYGLARILFNESFDLDNFYNDMIHYRKTLEVVTKDNDHEVNFIKTYQRVLQNDKWCVFWILFVLLIMIFL